jgi:hypothetical protein
MDEIAVRMEGLSARLQKEDEDGTLEQPARDLKDWAIQLRTAGRLLPIHWGLPGEPPVPVPTQALPRTGGTLIRPGAPPEPEEDEGARMARRARESVQVIRRNQSQSPGVP